MDQRKCGPNGERNGQNSYNPPQRPIASFEKQIQHSIAGQKLEFKVIDIEAKLQSLACSSFLNSQQVLPTVACTVLRANPSDKYNKFARDTGIELDVGLGIDTSAEAASKNGKALAPASRSQAPISASEVSKPKRQHRRPIYLRWRREHGRRHYIPCHYTSTSRAASRKSA